MAVRQLNTANFDYAMMLPLIIKAYKSNATITISEYDTDASPDVKVGSIFEVNGALFIVESADITPTGYTGVSNSTTFYLYWDVDPGAFIYSSTAPTWNDALQGWYNSNDRAFFSMFKDSGGTLYQNKSLLLSQNNYNMPNDLIVQNDLTVIGDVRYSSKRITTNNFLHGTMSDNDVFDKLDPFIPNNGAILLLNGGINVISTNNGPVSKAERLNSTTIRIHYLRIDTGAASQVDIIDEDATSRNVSLSW